MLRFFERSDGRFTRDRRKPLQKVLECFPAFQVVKEQLDRHSRSTKHGSPAKNLSIFDDHFHCEIVPRERRCLEVTRQMERWGESMATSDITRDTGRADELIW